MNETRFLLANFLNHIHTISMGEKSPNLLKQKLLSLQGPQTPYAPLRGTFRSENLILQAELNGTGAHINSRGAVPFGSKFSGYEYLTNTFSNSGFFTRYDPTLVLCV